MHAGTDPKRVTRTTYGSNWQPAVLVYGHKLYNQNKLPNSFLKVRWISRFQVVVPDTRLHIRTRLKVWLHYWGKWWLPRLSFASIFVWIRTFFCFAPYILPTVFKIEVFKCTLNAIWPFKIYLSQINPSLRNPKLKMKMSLEVFNIICPSQESTSVGCYHYKKWS